MPATAPAAPTLLRGSDNDFDQVWVESALTNEIDCACVLHLERTLLVLQAGDPDDGDGRLPPPNLTRGLDPVHHR